jgi:hypothetical protein
MAKQSADVTARDRSGVRQRVRRGIESGKEKYTGSSAEYKDAADPRQAARRRF